MKKMIASLAGLVIMLVPCGTAWAYGHSNRYGGSTSHSYGSTSHTSAAGTSTTHTYGQGTSHTNVYGGTSSGGYGSGVTHTTPYGTTAYASAYRPPTAYYGYHPPTTVGYYQGGCYHCGYGAAVAAGVVVGAAAASANNSAANANANAAAANANAAAANANAAAANANVAAAVTTANVMYEMGAVYVALPAGCVSPSVQGGTYYLCGNTWFSPSYGANGVYYRVVPTP